MAFLGITHATPRLTVVPKGNNEYGCQDSQIKGIGLTTDAHAKPCLPRIRQLRRSASVRTIRVRPLISQPTLARINLRF